MKCCRTLSMFAAGVALTFGVLVSLGSAQTGTNAFFNGRKIVIPQSSIPEVGRLQTNYFIVDPETWNSPQPPPGTETPGSLACVYELVKGPKGCPVSTSTKVPLGGVGAIAIVDAGYYPSAKSDLDAFSKYFGIPKADFTVVYADGKRPPEYSDWEVEEALDIEWAHAMAPKAKLFLVESVLCNSKNCNTDPTWQAVKVASNLVAQNGGGVISMSWGDAEWPQERNFDHYFTTPGVVYFAASGDSGIGVSIHPGASPNVVSVGGTSFNRDGNGNFINEVYGGGGGDISPYEPRPSYQDGIEKIVGKFRGYPDVGSDFCCAAIYLQGWGAVGGTSWSSPTMAGIVNAAGQLKKSTADELNMIYTEYANQKEYKAEFYDITQGASQCTTGWDLCAGVGSVRTYKGK
jgi:kumamolisin